MNRIDRLLAILLLLQHQHKIRTIDLATRFEVTERTIYRDIQALNEMGIPVVGIAGSGYELLETFRLPPIMLSHDEAIALSLGSRMLKTFATGKIALDAELALKRIENILPPPIRQSVAQLAQIIDFFPPPTRFDWHNPMLHSVIAAIQTSQVLQLTYHAYMETTASQRQVEPHTLTFSEGVWYLNGFCRLRQDMRSFRFNRIESLEILEEHFQPRQIFPAPKTVIAVMVHFKADSCATSQRMPALCFC